MNQVTWHPADHEPVYETVILCPTCSTFDHRSFNIFYTSTCDRVMLLVRYKEPEEYLDLNLDSRLSALRKRQDKIVALPLTSWLLCSTHEIDTSYYELNKSPACPNSSIDGLVEGLFVDGQTGTWCNNVTFEKLK